MKTATIHELKQELSGLKAPDVAALCLRLAKFKKENKELLTFLLFEAHDIENYAAEVKQEMDALFDDVNRDSVFWAKKTIRKILRITNKHIKYTGNKQTEVELLLYFCEKFIALGFNLRRNQVFFNLLNGQVKKIIKLIDGLHEDLQYDYRRQLEAVLEAG